MHVKICTIKKNMSITNKTSNRVVFCPFDFNLRYSPNLCDIVSPPDVERDCVFSVKDSGKKSTFN